MPTIYAIGLAVNVETESDAFCLVADSSGDPTRRPSGMAGIDRYRFFFTKFSSQVLQRLISPSPFPLPPQGATTRHLLLTVTRPCLVASTIHYRHYSAASTAAPQLATPPPVPQLATPIPAEPLQSANADATAPLLDTIAQTPTSDVIVQTAMQIGDLRAMGLVHSTPVGFLQAFLEAIHVWTGLPWWGTIVVATLIIRTSLVPFIINIQRNNARLMNINPEVQEHMKEINKAKVNQDVETMQRHSTELQGLFEKNQCHPIKSIYLPLIQMPIMISFFMGLRAMSELPVPQFKEGGLFWFTDLTSSDPYYILPILSSAGILAILEAGTEAGMTNPQTNMMKNVFRAMTVVMVPFTAWLPTSVFVYWMTSNTYSIAQILALRNKRLRSLLNIPILKHSVSELQKNQPSMVDKFKSEFELRQKQSRELELREREVADALARRAAKRRS
ncbi:60Kd inner membrane protein-domain-containing protein [Endogone sp. FLAS-F59071]|nr:60Kd inner membrane protein-domain-containing protein [Endogone sp. FLAS-F59071]|eukprot:RUS17339.1 60Kd inner membrane protein-domain-containing protein [Endogone sp. FLAS-F59071]